MFVLPNNNLICAGAMLQHVVHDGNCMLQLERCNFMMCWLQMCALQMAYLWCLSALQHLNRKLLAATCTINLEIAQTNGNEPDAKNKSEEGQRTKNTSIMLFKWNRRSQCIEWNEQTKTNSNATGDSFL